MLTARLYAHGPPEIIVLEEMPTPVPQTNEALVEVRAASVNFPDVLIAANRYQVPVSVPFTPGSEFADNAPERAADADAMLDQLVAEGLRPRISAVYPLHAVVEAMQAVASGQTLGKVVLEMESGRG